MFVLKEKLIINSILIKSRRDWCALYFSVPKALVSFMSKRGIVQGKHFVGAPVCDGSNTCH